MSDGKGKTAAELMAQLQADPEFRRREAEPDLKRAEREAALKAEDRHICAALAEMGITVDSVYDLVNTRTLHADAVPVLVEWLPKAKNDRMKEGIARALSFQGAGEEAVHVLLAEFESNDLDSLHMQSAKWAIGNAICEVASPSMLEDLCRLVLDERHGSARQMLAIAVGKTGKVAKDQALKVLLQLLEDPMVQGHALSGLGHLRHEASRSAIQPFLDHQKAWIREEARKALAGLKEM